MKTSYLATIVLALAALAMPAANAAKPKAPVDEAATASAKQALASEMGELGKDMTVTVDKNGVATLGGWAKEPKDVDKARYIIKKLPGVKKSYSNRVKTQESTNEY